MKKIIVLILMAFCLTVTPVPAQSADIGLAWDAPPDADLMGYRLYHSNVSGDYSEATPVEVLAPETTFTFFNMPDGPHFFVATAFDENGNESNFSNECNTTVDTTPPGIPGGLSCQQQ